MPKTSKDIKTLERFIRRLSSRPDEWKNHQQVAINVEEKKHGLTLEKLCCMCKSSSKDECANGGNDIDVAKEVNIEEHLMTFEDLEHKFHTSLDRGLTQHEADTRFQRNGPNAFSPPKQKSVWSILLKELTGGFALIMWLTAIASLVCYFIEWNKQDVCLI